MTFAIILGSSLSLKLDQSPTSLSQAPTTSFLKWKSSPKSIKLLPTHRSPTKSSNNRTPLRSGLVFSIRNWRSIRKDTAVTRNQSKQHLRWPQWIVRGNSKIIHRPKNYSSSFKSRKRRIKISNMSSRKSAMKRSKRINAFGSSKLWSKIWKHMHPLKVVKAVLLAKTVMTHTKWSSLRRRSIDCDHWTKLEMNSISKSTPRIKVFEKQRHV